MKLCSLLDGSAYRLGFPPKNPCLANFNPSTMDIERESCGSSASTFCSRSTFFRKANWVTFPGFPVRTMTSNGITPPNRSSNQFKSARIASSCGKSPAMLPVTRTNERCQTHQSRGRPRLYDVNCPAVVAHGLLETAAPPRKPNAGPGGSDLAFCCGGGSQLNTVGMISNEMTNIDKMFTEAITPNCLRTSLVVNMNAAKPKTWSHSS